MAKMSRQGKLIRDAESFAAGCSRSRLELRLVDEIHRLNAVIENTRRYVEFNKEEEMGMVDASDDLAWLGDK